MALTEADRQWITNALAPIISNQWIEAAQNGTTVVTDDRVTGAKTWITNGLQKREVIDPAERQTMQEILGLPVGAPQVRSWVILQRIPTVT